MNDENFIIASKKSWNKNLSTTLQSLTKKKFKLISDSKDINLNYLKKINPSYIFFPHWSDMIPEEIYTNFECVIFHMTDLPFGRGGSPLQNLINHGIYKTKISAIKCIKEVDAGPIYLKKSLDLNGSAQQIYEKASQVIESMIIDIVKNNPEPKLQVGEPSFFKRRTPEQSNLKNVNSIVQAYDLIRSLDADGYPKAFIKTNNMNFQFTKAKYKKNKLFAKVEIKFINKKEK
tara:strand:- start:1714 stop:2409 length:696 start_codon:yes stop_codon:yes gene_type:complete